MVTPGLFTRNAARPALAPPRLLLILTLIVIAAGGAHADHAADTGASREGLGVEAELEPGTLHVQAQARYTLRLFQAVSVSELAFHGPESSLAEIRPLGDKIHEITRNGRRYRVTEKHYAVIPFSSGTLKLTGGHVTLRTGEASSSRHRLDAPALTLEVRPVPAGHRPDAWLPARAVMLTESWQPHVAELRPGQPLRRTIRVEAKGAAADRIPPVTPEADGFTVHPEPPRLEEREEDGWVTGIREQTWRLVPRRAGELTLAPVQMPWWDVVAGQAREDTLPARTVTVAASPESRTIVPETPTTPATEGTTDQADASATPAGGANAAHPAAILLAAMALIAASTVAMRLRRATATLRMVRRACRANDPDATRIALLQWSREIGAPRPACLLTLADHIGGAATARELAALDRHLYGKQRVAWNSRQLVTALRREHPQFRPWRLQPTRPETIR